MNLPNTTHCGFTLLELLVALAVFAILAVAAYGGLRNVLFTRVAVEAQTQRLAAVQLAIHRLSQDLEQAVPRGIRDEYGAPQAALLGDALAGERLILTRAGWANPLGQPRASLQRVAYQVRGNQLWRLHWPVLDRGGLAEPREMRVLDQVREFRIRFLDENASWRNDWPPPASAGNGPRDLDALPRAVEISLTLEDWGEITRLLLLPG
jgi:general secretion pathway protein J